MKIKDNILSILEIKTEEYGEKTAFGIKTQHGWSEFTYKGIGLLSRQLAYHFMHGIELQKGEKLAILSESKPEYGACVFASVIAGLITVPLDIKLTRYELKSILSDCLPSVLLVSNHYLDTALFLKQEIPSIKHVIVMDKEKNTDSCQSIYEVSDKCSAKWRIRSPKSTALIIYTSGTTGSPKGVEISFGNIIAQLHDLKIVLKSIIGNSKDLRTLSILPMNHLFEMTVGFSTFLNLGFSVYYTQSLKPKDILGIMQEKRIEFMIVVPAFLRLLKSSIESSLKKAPKSRQRMFWFMYHLAKFVPSYKIKKLMFNAIHKEFGGSFSACVSGGAPLDVEVGRFFQRIGIKVFQGYGLTETSPVVSVNADRRNDLASIGRPLPSFQAKIDKQNGELMLKGPSVMKGYYNQPELTREAITEDGWLHTGDIAKFGPSGHLYITGRIKNMIVLSGGKKVFPEEVEAVLERSEYIAEVCVLSLSKTSGAKENTEEVAAVVVPKNTLYNEHSDEEIEQMIRADVKSLSQRLTQYKRPTNVIIKKDALPKTATNKVKRKEVKELLLV